MSYLLQAFGCNPLSLKVKKWVESKLSAQAAQSQPGDIILTCIVSSREPLVCVCV